MEKWQLKSNRSKRKYLLLSDEKIGHVYFTDEEKLDLHRQIKNSDFPFKSELLPFHYIRKISSPLSSPTVTIFYKKESELEYEFEDTKSKNNFFETFIENNSKFELKLKEVSIIQSIRIQLLALLILSIYLGWCYFSAIGIENGTHPGRDLAIVLLLASLGTKTLEWIFTGVILVLGLRMYFNIKSRETIQVIDF